MKKTLELAWGVIRRPTPTFRKIKEEKPLGRGIFIAFLPLFIMFYISIFRGSGRGEDFITSIPYTYLVIMAYTALLNFTARLLRNKSEYKSLLISNFFISGVVGSIKYLVRTGISFTKHPSVATVCGPRGCHTVDVPLFSQLTLGSLCEILFAFWVLSLLILALKEIYRFSTPNAMTTFGLTFLLILPLFIVTIPNLYSIYLPICIVILALLVCVTLTLIFRKILLEETFKRKTFYFFAILGALFIVLLRVGMLNGVTISGNIQARYCVYPEKIITGSKGNIYVTSIGYGGIYKFDPEGKFLGRFESDYPNKIAANGKEIIYIAGWGYKKGCKIQKFAEDGKLIETILLEPPPVSTGHIQNMDVDSQGNIYLLVSLKRSPKKREYKVQKFSPEGKFLMEFGEKGKGDEQFYLPGAITVDERGNIYVTGIDRFQKFNSKGRLVRIFKSPKEKDPEYCGAFSWDIKTDREENIYTLSSALKKKLEKEVKVWKVKKFNEHGKPIITIEITGNGYEKFWHPAGMAIGENGCIYIADPYNHRIQVFNNQGKFLKNIKHNPFMIKWYEESLIGRLLESISYHKPLFRRAKK